VQLFSRERPRCPISLEHELVTLLPCFESLIGCHTYQRTVGGPERWIALLRVVAKKCGDIDRPLPPSTAFYHLLAPCSSPSTSTIPKRRSGCFAVTASRPTGGSRPRPRARRTSGRPPSRRIWRRRAGPPRKSAPPSSRRWSPL